MNLRISELPESERPRERILRDGARTLSLRECLAVILGSGPRGKGCMGLAADILRLSGDETDDAFFATLRDGFESYIAEVHGLGNAQKARVLALFELSRRYADYRLRLEPRHSPNPNVSVKKALERIAVAWRSAEKEWIGFVPVHPDGKTGVLHIVERGVRTHVCFDPADLFLKLLVLRVRAFYLFHNHPSNSLRASHEDRELTDRVTAVAESLGLRCLGHWIVCARGEAPILV